MPASPRSKKTPAKKAEAKAPARKPKGKGSAAGDTLETWLGALTPEQAEIAARLCEIVAREVPESTFALRDSLPVFDLGGPFAFLKALDGQLGFGFWRGADLVAPAGFMHGEGAELPHLRIGKQAPVPDSVIVLLVRQAARLNRELGDPTRT